MKKLSIILMVSLFIMTMTQCKKNLQDIQTISGEVSYISLNIADAKVGVNTANGKVTFDKDDVLYVASNGKYVGRLIYNGDSFVGNIEGAAIDRPLYFYFLGNLEPGKLDEGSSTSCCVVIDDQTKNLPVISFGESREAFNGGGSYSAFLYNKCALMKFKVETTSDKSVCLTGMNNRVTVFFLDNKFKYDMEDEGIIKLPEGSGEKWAIVLPQEETRIGEDGSLFTEDELYVGVRPALPTIECNDFFDEAIRLELSDNVLNDGAFTSSRAKRVTFSKGNLQYVSGAGRCYWDFAKHQYDVIGMTQNGTDSEEVSRDLFGWGTGDNPANVSDLDDDYSVFVDWGSKINKRDGKETWRTLTKNEWDYIIYRRKASTVNGVANARYTKAKVCGVNGLILFPDVYTHPTGAKQPECINYTTSNQSWDVNDYDESEWREMEDAGAIFLPAAGMRNGVTVERVGEYGRYWSSYSDDERNAYDLMFTDYRPYPTDVIKRSEGCAVRLVHE